MNATERFLRYVRVETTSDESSPSCPSTQNQLTLGRMLADELHQMGAANARMDENGYVYATIPGKGDKAGTKVGLIAHMDTSDAVSGPTDPQIIRNYDGSTITLKNGTVIDGFSFLSELRGEDLIVTDGSSVLGADDKAGVAEIMTLAERLLAPDAPEHCTVQIGFTPDEEIGRGADLFDVKEFDAEWGYTVDGGPIGEVEYENFNAASCKVTIIGVSIHPGSAKNQMKNAILMAMEFNSLLPEAETPAHTEGYEGFHHLNTIRGNEELTELYYILRDHDAAKLEEKKSLMQDAAGWINRKYGKGTATVEIRDSYRNMKEIVCQHPEIIEKAISAFSSCGIEAKTVPIRGGTDGARLSFEGLPCPNLSTGGYNYHGRKELIPVSSIEKMVDVLEALVRNA